MHVEHGGILADADTDEKGCERHDRDEACHPCPARLDRGLPPSRKPRQTVEDREGEQRGAEPHRPGLRQPFAVFQMHQPLVPKAAVDSGRRQEDKASPRATSTGQINDVIPRLRKDEHYVVDEKAHSVTLTDDGVELAQKLMGIGNLYDPINLESLHILNQCLRAHSLYKRDVNYLVTDDGKVLIIDEFTGRVLAGRRWSDGLHQAVEAKENVRIQEETRTMATITFQNLFRLYKKLGGMTGTADTEATEFHETYKLSVIATPTNKPMIREDHQDVVYKTEREKFTAVDRRDPRVPREGPARARRDDERREEQRDREPAQEEEDPARGPQRQAPRARGVRRRAGGAEGRDHGQHEHGRPRDGHRPRRQPGDDREARVSRAGSRSRQGAGGVRRAGREARQVPARPRATRSGRSEGCTSWAPSGTSRGASTTSSAAARAARATRARAASISRSRTTSCASSRATASSRSWSGWGCRTTSPSSTRG